MAITIKHRILNPTILFIIGCLLLIIGLFAIKTYFPNPLFWSVALVTVLLFFFKILVVNKDHFGFVILLFFLSHFSYLDNQGGLWNISSLIVLLLFVFRKSINTYYFKSDVITNVLLFIFVLCNIIGLIVKNPSSVVLRVEGFIMLSAYVLVFLFISNVKISIYDLRRFFGMLYLTSFYLFFAALNQRYGFIKSKLPFLPAKHIVNGHINLTSNSASVFGNSELYGEYSILILIIVLAFINNVRVFKTVFIKSYYFYIISIISVLGAFMSGARSAVILIIFAITVIFGSNILKQHISKSFFRIFLATVLFSTFFLITQVDFGLESSKEDFEQLEGTEFSLNNIISGKAINRYEPFKYALIRLREKSWYIGYGLAPLESNIRAWWGYTDNIPYVDFHNFYYTAPMLYGYIGTTAFLLLILILIFRNLKIIYSSIYFKPFYFYYILVMPLFWSIFLIDQWKISILRNPNYHMIIWIFMGLNYAMINNFKNEIKKSATTNNDIKNKL